MKNILITGGSGMIGTSVRKTLENKNFRVAILTRKSKIDGIKSFQWDYHKGYLEEGAIEFADVIIHLAGENISAGRWTKKQKKQIVESRVLTGKLLAESIARASKKPRLFLSASATGYYGSKTSDQIFIETDESGVDILAKTVVEWEKSTDLISSLGIKVNKLRTGVVFSEKGGALPKITAPIKYGLGTPLGSGKQWMPWISLQDLANMYVFLIEHNVPEGIFNAVAPEHINNRDLMKTIARHYSKAFFLPNVPAILLKLLLGDMSTILLDGSRVSSEKILKEGFVFRHDSLQKFLAEEKMG